MRQSHYGQHRWHAPSRNKRFTPAKIEVWALVDTKISIGHTCLRIVTHPASANVMSGKSQFPLPYLLNTKVFENLLD
jgi:hypothetical protein